MTSSDNDKLIRDIRQMLDANPPDTETRHALQRVRAKVLTTGTKRSWRIPWLEFALAATLVAVLAVNLPGKPAAITDRQAQSSAVATKPSTVAKPVHKTAPTSDTDTSIDADLLENLELYEDADFYQWLSEQDGEGALDA
jgi:hypothetical protein